MTTLTERTHNSDDGLCVFAGCKEQAVSQVSWNTSEGFNSCDCCDTHAAEIWNRTTPGTLARDTFTIVPKPKG